MKIGIDCGHTLTGADIGAVGNGFKEQNLTRDVGYRVINKLRDMGYKVIDCTINSCKNLNSSLAYRVDKANNNNVDLFVSIHFNAFNSKAYGTEVYTYKGKNLKQARDTLNSICSLGYANRGIKDGSNLYVIRNSKMPAMLVECCFVDSVTDMKKFNAESMANAIVKGLTGSNAIPSKPTPQPKPINRRPMADNNWVARLQTACNKQGFSNQAVDGIPGPNTLNGCPTCRIGAQGEITKLIQIKLNSLGYNCGAADGMFGVRTRQAVIRFQTDSGLVADGIVGTNTWRALLGI